MTAADVPGLKVGQKLWFVPREMRWRQPYEVLVSKVGRRWAHLSDGHRMPVGSLIVDGGGHVSPGRCWLSREEWEAAQNRQLSWSRVRSFFDRKYSIPDIVTDEQIKEVARILGIELSEDPGHD